MPPTASRRQPGFVATGWFATGAGRAVLASETGVLQLAAQERPGQSGLLLCPGMPGDARTSWPLLCLHDAEHGFAGDVRCGLPLPLPSDSCGVVVVQHLADLSARPAELLEECARVLLPGGRLWLLSLNPLSPYRLRWRGQGPRAAEPVTWRRRLRALGLAPEPVSQGLGPVWSPAPHPGQQDGAGLRAACLLRAEKRRLPMTPLRTSRPLGWRPEIA